MAQALGSKGRLIYQEEPSFKTDPTTFDGILLPFVDEDLRSSRNLIDSELIRAKRDATKPVLGNKDVTGSIRTYLQPYIGSLIKGVLGSVTTTGTGPYVHTITSADTLPSYTIEKGFTNINQYLRYSGCKINSMTLNVTSEGFQEVTFNVIGAKENTATSSSVFSGGGSYTDYGKSCYTGFEITTIQEGGFDIAIVTEIRDLTIENNLDTNVFVIGGQSERNSLPEGKIRVTGTLTALFEDITLYNKAVNSTETSLKIVYQFGTGDGTSGNEYVEFYIPEMIYQPQAPVISGPAGVLVDLPFQAYYDNSVEQSIIQITIKSTQATL